MFLIIAFLNAVFEDSPWRVLCQQCIIGKFDTQLNTLIDTSHLIACMHRDTCYLYACPGLLGGPCIIQKGKLKEHLKSHVVCNLFY